MSQPSVLRSRFSLAVAFVLSVGVTSQVFAQSPVTTGDLVVVRVGTGPGALTNASTPTFLDEYDVAGTLVQSVPLPTAINGANLPLTNSGTATSEGNLNLSDNGQYLVLAGYGTPPGTGSVAGTATSGATPVLRVVARVDRNMNIDTTTGLTAYSGNNIRSATSVTGNEFWVGGPVNGVSYVSAIGSSASTQLATNVVNIRTVHVFGGQLYTSSASGQFQGVSTIGTGLPTTSGQAATLLPGFPTATGPSNYDFFFADANTLYVADDRTVSGGGIQKWTLSAGTWTLQYVLAPSAATGCRGVTGTVVGGVALLYATTTETSANRLVSVIDTGATATFTTLATAPANTVFRGIRFMYPLASVTAVGAGCAGSSPVAPVLSSTQLPALGNLGFSVDVTLGLAGAPAFLFASIGTDPIGTPVGGGCTVYLDLPSLLTLMNVGFTPTGPVFTDINGTASIPFPIPGIPQLAGLHAGVQGALVDAAAPIGFALTNALDLAIF